jgi:hypothetical protein
VNVDPRGVPATLEVSRLRSKNARCEKLSSFKNPAKTVNPRCQPVDWQETKHAKRTFSPVRVRFRLSGICKTCDKSFMSRNEDLDEALGEIQSAFDVHKCERENASQSAARIVREATEQEIGSRRTAV